MLWQHRDCVNKGLYCHRADFLCVSNAGWKGSDSVEVSELILLIKINATQRRAKMPGEMLCTTIEPIKSIEGLAELWKWFHIDGILTRNNNYSLWRLKSLFQVTYVRYQYTALFSGSLERSYKLFSSLLVLTPSPSLFCFSCYSCMYSLKTVQKFQDRNCFLPKSMEMNIDSHSSGHQTLINVMLMSCFF